MSAAFSYSADDEIPWRRFAPEDEAPRGPWRGTGPMHLSFAEAREFYPAEPLAVQELLRDALRIFTERGWNGGKYFSRSSYSQHAGKVTPAFAITLATKALTDAPFNIHVVARAAMETLIKRDLDEWNNDRTREAGEVTELFCRAIFRAGTQPKAKSA